MNGAATAISAAIGWGGNDERMGGNGDLTAAIGWVVGLTVIERGDNGHLMVAIGLGSNGDHTGQ